MSSAPAQRGLEAALSRYRVVAWITGVFLVILCCVGVPLQYGAGQSTVVAIVGPLHGVLFIVYLLVAYDVIRRMHWSSWPSVAVLLAGTVPFLTFVAERYVTARVRAARLPRTAPTAGSATSSA